MTQNLENRWAFRRGHPRFLVSGFDFALLIRFLSLNKPGISEEGKWAVRADISLPWSRHCSWRGMGGRVATVPIDACVYSRNTRLFSSFCLEHTVRLFCWLCVRVKQVRIEPLPGKRVEHAGVKIELLGQIGVLIPHDFQPTCARIRHGLFASLWCWPSESIFFLACVILWKSDVNATRHAACRAVLWPRKLLWLHLPWYVYTCRPSFNEASLCMCFYLWQPFTRVPPCS